MENISKRNARLLLIWIANRRKQALKRDAKNLGPYWKTVLRHDILDARCVNRGELIPAKRW